MKQLLKIFLVFTIVASFSTSNAFAFEWTKLGGNPFRGTCHDAVARMDFLTPAEKQEAIGIFTRGEGMTHFVQINLGDIFSGMISGNGDVQRNVRCAWANRSGPVNAVAFRIGCWEILNVSYCNNWLWRPAKVLPPPAQELDARAGYNEPEELAPEIQTTTQETSVSNTNRASAKVDFSPTMNIDASSHPRITVVMPAPPAPPPTIYGSQTYGLGYIGETTTYCPASQAGQPTETVKQVLGFYTQSIPNITATGGTAYGGNPTALSTAAASATATAAATATVPDPPPTPPPAH